MNDHQIQKCNVSAASEVIEVSLGPILSCDQMYLYFVFCICTCLTSSFSKYASGRAVVGGAGGPDTIPHISPHTCPHYHQHFDFAHITTNTLTSQHFD